MVIAPDIKKTKKPGYPKRTGGTALFELRLIGVNKKSPIRAEAGTGLSEFTLDVGLKDRHQRQFSIKPDTGTEVSGFGGG
jgi:hypothetical protein